MTKAQLKGFFWIEKSRGSDNILKDTITEVVDNLGIYHIYNTKVKTYENGLKKFKRYSYDINKGICSNNRHNGSYDIDQLEEKLSKYLKKVRGEIVDISMNNLERFEYFITLTFSPSELNGYTHDKAIKRLINWLHRQRFLNSGMYYILVPELHKKSGHLHFHGLIGNVPNWKLIPARNPHTKRIIKQNGCTIYNLSNFKIGYTTISKIKNNEAVCNYISKYATKDLIKLKHKKRYWYSRNLTKPKTDIMYLDKCLTEHLKGENIVYSDEFKTESSSLELVNIQLPIIDIMLTSLFCTSVLILFIAVLFD